MPDALNNDGEQTAGAPGLPLVTGTDGQVQAWVGWLRRLESEGKAVISAMKTIMDAENASMSDTYQMIAGLAHSRLLDAACALEQTLLDFDELPDCVSQKVRAWFLPVKQVYQACLWDVLASTHSGDLEWQANAVDGFLAGSSLLDPELLSLSRLLVFELKSRHRRHVENAKESNIESRDYVSATKIRAKHTPAGIVLDHRKLVRFLKYAKDIRQLRPIGRDGKPRANRLLVHIADWHNNADLLKKWVEAQPDQTDAASQKEIEERKAAVKRRKSQE
jgi:hypothetical protein